MVQNLRCGSTRKKQTGQIVMIKSDQEEVGFSEDYLAQFIHRTAF
jgi:hypothetical protein